ncbi:hypothetical protein [Terrisporobacter mayombei]|uniref:hypothetical protein n=1 Tax=Terrisporobacter mayombei TaxID=1541 RepID=UPI0026596845|nr:hypothetical protein [Terrisporobacter mayombei]MCC3668634.1 hypothetical protein [Terrisporobacter mayombei]
MILINKKNKIIKIFGGKLKLKKQLKTLGLGLVLGTSIIAMVRCSSTETGSGTSNTSREDEVNAMLTEVVSNLGEEIDFEEAYLNKYMQ